MKKPNIFPTSPLKPKRTIPFFTRRNDTFLLATASANVCLSLFYCSRSRLQLKFVCAYGASSLIIMSFDLIKIVLIASATQLRTF